MKDRRGLVESVHEEVGLCNGEKLCAYMRSKYYWRGMRALCLEVAQQNLAR
jgi:hypothetical protein